MTGQLRSTLTDQLRRPQAIATIIALLAGGGFFATRGGGSKNAASAPTVTVNGEVLREPVTVPGPDPFTPPVESTPTTAAPAIPESTITTIDAQTTTATAVADGQLTTSGPVELALTPGDTPGLYGGTLSNSECDKEKLIGFLEQNSDKAAAWAQVQQIQPAEIRGYISQLTPVVLGADTRVTNHGFRSGKPTARQAVLQTGTSVLVDNFGAPRARCSCGNPLLPPVAQSGSASFTGPSWPKFDPGNLQVVTPAVEPISSFRLRDVTTGAGIDRPVATSGLDDVETAPPPPVAEPRSRPTPTVITPPIVSATDVPATDVPSTDAIAPATIVTRQAAIPEPNAFIQDLGDVRASSDFSPQFASRFAVDGDPTTSWFSAGPTVDGPTSRFRWTYSEDELITFVRVVGNGGNSNLDFRRNFGFESVTIRVLDDSGQVDFEQTVSLPGTPDPDAVVQPGVRGHIIELEFSGSEAIKKDCGGFAELKVGVTR